jgi:hypothetical protein
LFQRGLKYHQEGSSSKFNEFNRFLAILMPYPAKGFNFLREGAKGIRRSNDGSFISCDNPVRGSSGLNRKKLQKMWQT